MKVRPARKNKIELLNTYSKSISGQQRPVRHKSPIITMKPINFNKKSVESIRDEESTLRISIKDAPNANYFEDDELDMEIIDITDINNDKKNQNMIIVDLRENGSPTTSKENGMTILNISLDRKNGKVRRTRDSRDNKGGKSMRNSTSMKNMSSLTKSVTKIEEGVFSQDLNILEKKVTGDFGQKVQDVINISTQIEHFSAQDKHEQNIIKKAYKPPQTRISFDSPITKKNNYNETSSHVLMESTIEDNIMKTNELINDAINTIGLSKFLPTQTYLEEQDDYLDQTYPQPHRMIPVPTKNNCSNSPKPIQDVTPTSFAGRIQNTQKYNSPLRTEYEALIQKSEEVNKSKEIVQVKPKKPSKSKKRSKMTSTKRNNDKPGSFSRNEKFNSLNNHDETDSGLDEEHAKGIKDSANKLRSKMQSQSILAAKKGTVDLKSSIDESKYKPVKRNTSKSEISSTERSIREPKEDLMVSQIERSPGNFGSLASPSQYYGVQNYDSKMTFSGEKHDSDTRILMLEEKLHQAENLVLNLQKKIDSNDQAYKDKYAKTVREIQELEADNISLHQLVKSKMNEMQELKNENTEYKHKISSNSMASHKMSITEEELRIKIEELMNKTTELNFLLRKKEEEFQTADRKLKIIQIDLNNAKNVEKSLQNEIDEMKKGRDKITNELQELKDENCQYQVSSREQK